MTALQVSEQTVEVERRGFRRILTPAQAREAHGIHHAERVVGNAIDRGIQRAAVVELPGTRRGQWEYRESCLTIDPWTVHAYVGDLTGADAVRASNEFLEQVGAIAADAGEG